MFCDKCGNQIEEGASFCTQCGTKVVYNEEIMNAQIHASDDGDEQMSDNLDVVLMDVGVNKISVIRTVREWTGLGLKEAKELVEKAPVLLKKGVTREDAQLIKIFFMKVGADVTFINQDGVSENVIVHCKSCGAALKDKSMVCSSCGSVFELPHSDQKSGRSSTKIALIVTAGVGSIALICFFVLCLAIGIVMSNTDEVSVSSTNKNIDSKTHETVGDRQFGNDQSLDQDLVSDYDIFGEGELTIPTLDPALCGRWRSLTDNSYIELMSDGTCNTNFQSGIWTLDKLISISWEINSDGYLQINRDYYGENTIEYIEQNPNYNPKYAQYDNSGYNSSPDALLYNGQYMMYREPDYVGEGIFAHWRAAGDLSNGLVLYPDGTGYTNQSEMRWDYSEISENIYKLSTVSTAHAVYDYYVANDSLTIFFSDGARGYIRVDN